MPPNISSLTPGTGPVGASVQITGSGFIVGGATGTVSFNGTPASIYSYFGTQIVVAVPFGATTGPVTVTVAGQTSNGITFTVTASAVPTIISLTPATGPVGQAVKITGTNFGAAQGTSTVTFSGHSGLPVVRIFATTTSWSPTVINVIVPSGTQTGNVIVNVAGANSNALVFTVVNASNGGMQSPLGLLLIPAQLFNTQVVLTFDPTSFNDLSMVSFYNWKVEEVIPGRTPSCTRQIITYRDLGIATLTATISGYDQNANAPTSASETFTIGSAGATQKLCTVERGLSLTAQDLQYSILRDPGAGPISITKLRLEGRVETGAYA